MKFYNIDAIIKDDPFFKNDISEKEKEILKAKFLKAVNDEMKKNDNKILFIVKESPLEDMPDGLVACVFSNNDVDLYSVTESLYEKAGLNCNEINIEETTSQNFFSNVSYKRRSEFFQRFGDDYAKLDNLFMTWRREDCAYDDRIADDGKSFKAILKSARDNYLGARYEAELKRILSDKKTKNFIGIPAHYIIGSTDLWHRRTMIRDLISGLYIKGRLTSRRYTIVPLDNPRVSFTVLNKIYAVNDGATVLLKINDNYDGDGYKKDPNDIDEICDIVKKHSSRVLTVFSIASASEAIRTRIKNSLCGIAVVDISEDLHNKESAVEILKVFAKKDKFRLSESFIDKIYNSDRYYDYNTLVSIYAKWRHEYLSTAVYPAYKSFYTRDEEIIEEKKKSDAYDELKSMVGLTAVKK